MKNPIVRGALALPPPPPDRHVSLGLYLELLETSEQLLLAGLRHRIGPDGDLSAAFREWNRRQMEADTQKTIRMLEELVRREAAYAGRKPHSSVA